MNISSDILESLLFFKYASDDQLYSRLSFAIVSSINQKVTMQTQGLSTEATQASISTVVHLSDVFTSDTTNLVWNTFQAGDYSNEDDFIGISTLPRKKQIKIFNL